MMYGIIVVTYGKIFTQDFDLGSDFFDGSSVCVPESFKALTFGKVS